MYTLNSVEECHLSGPHSTSGCTGQKGTIDRALLALVTIQCPVSFCQSLPCQQSVHLPYKHHSNKLSGLWPSGKCCIRLWALTIHFMPPFMRQSPLPPLPLSHRDHSPTPVYRHSHSTYAWPWQPSSCCSRDRWGLDRGEVSTEANC